MPIAHLAIDVTVLIAGVHQIGILRQRVRRAYLEPSTKRVAILQEAGAPGWDFKYDVPPIEQFVFLSAGNLPVLLVSGTVRPPGVGPNGDWQWFAIQEVLSLPIWFLIGAYSEVRVRLHRILVSYVWMRAPFATLAFFPTAMKLGSALETFCWAAAGIYGISVSLIWAARRLFVPTRVA